MEIAASSNYQALLDDTTNSMENSAKLAVNQVDWSETGLWGNFQQGRLAFNE